MQYIYIYVSENNDSAYNGGAQAGILRVPLHLEILSTSPLLLIWINQSIGIVLNIILHILTNPLL